ncbi:bifunctional lysylphosphatidylglycerol flippase/synthetase MprF [Pseudonocardia sp. RS010]|uniref:bifunctional lysylphosphatidylglycerol flippase/synthetase MprF n=1 Tax=Pseudonocardia sp. RS010 TaxID=3385979 RepID=UPI0039A28B54
MSPAGVGTSGGPPADPVPSAPDATDPAPSAPDAAEPAPPTAERAEREAGGPPRAAKAPGPPPAGPVTAEAARSASAPLPAAAGRTAPFEVWASRLTAALPQAWHRIPFTIAVIAVTVVVGLVGRTIWRPLWQEGWFPQVAYGVPALQEGRLWTLFTGWFFAITPGQYVSGLLLFAVVVGACEIRMGTRVVAVTALVGEIGGVLLASLLVWALSHTSWPWAVHLATVRDAGFTTGALTVLAVTTAALHSPWRLRIRALLGFYVLVAFLFEGTLSDVAHLLAVAVGFAVGQRLFGVEPGFGPRTRRETRLLAFAGLLAIALTELVVLLFPGAGPFGATGGAATSLLDVLIDVVVVGIVANALRLGKRWAWWVTVVLGGLNALVAVAAVVILVAGGVVTDEAITLGTGVLWIAVLVVLLSNRRAFRVPIRRRLPGGLAASEGDALERARTLLQSVGGSTMSWMTLWPEMHFYFLRDGRGYVGYQRHAGIALALADPVAPPGTIAAAVTEFTEDAERGGLTPCLFSVTDTAAEAARSAGWRTVQIAEDTLIDLPGLAFTGKKWQAVRTALNKAKREGIEFRIVTLAEESFAVLAQVRAISEEWVGDKGLPEMGFTLGGVDEALDPAVKVGLAIDAGGSIHGVTSWLPVYAEGGRVRGWTLDVMRRRTDGFRSAMEFMIASACLAFGQEGYEFVSLSGAPLARGEGSTDLDRTDRLLDKLGGALEPFYGFRSLHAFKAKFSPRYEPVHLAFRDEADLPRIGIALTRAYLPDATPRQLIAAGFSAGGKEPEGH